MFKTKRPVACEIFTSAICNLNCKYCYIPKTSFLKDIHENIISKIDSGEYIEDIYTIYGDNLTSLSLWGTEQTLVLDHISKILSKLFDKFAKLNTFSFSTNLIGDINSIISFIECLPKNKKIRLKMQVSIDGPPIITDINRGSGTTEKIINNLKLFGEQIGNKDIGDIHISISPKATWGANNIEYFSKDIKKIYEYVDFCNNLCSTVEKYNNRNLHIDMFSPVTLAVPGKYTVQDGKNWATVCEYINEVDKNCFKFDGIYKSWNAYKLRFHRIMSYIQELFKKPSMFTCSGGDSNWQIDNEKNLHICHRSLFSNIPNYIEEVMKTDIENWDISNFESGTLELMNNRYITDINDQSEIDRFVYTMGGYHNFLKFKVNCTIPLIKELMLCGQAEEYFKNNDLCMLLSIFLNSALSCPAESLLNTGNVHIQPISIVRMFANGAFSNILNGYLKDIYG